MKLLTSASDITKKIESVRKSGVSFQNGVQLAAVSIMAHMAKYRDKTLLQGLYDVMPNGSRRKMMADWFALNAGSAMAISYDKKGLDIVLPKKTTTEWVQFVDGIDKIIDAMIEKPWHAYKAEKGEQDRSFVALVKNLTKRANGKDADERMLELVTAAKALLDDDELAKLEGK